MGEVRTLLIANRGEIARRIIRTAREMGIRTIAVYADPDRLAPHVQEADVSVPLGGSTAADSYLNRAEILKAAEWQGADSIHPGYGFLAESSSFARAVTEAGLTWIGPPPRAIAAMGDKIEAKRTAIEAGLPVLPSTELVGDSPQDWAAQAADVGYPLLVKASAGGGGKGMRLVAEPDELAAAVETARREALASFGNGAVFAERCVLWARHIEIQVFADRHGEVVHLGERECSIQRRHQKILEESPSPLLSPALRARMGDAAVELTRSIGYEGAGTVEFLVDDADLDEDGVPRFWFLEMNTRLQVEHAVTEGVTGLDLVRMQIEVARGEHLGVRQDDVTLTGHAIEVRLYAEDPANGWLPSVGRIHRWRHGATPGVRYDDGVETGTVVSPHFDPMLAKVVVHAATRDEATDRLARALREMHIHGVTTNRDYLVDVLTSADFRAGDTHTDFVVRNPPVPDDEDGAAYARQWQRFNAIVGPHLAAAALRAQARPDQNPSPWPFVPTGWRNVGGSVSEVRPGASTWQLVQTQSGFASQTVSFLGLDERWDVTYARVRRDHPLALRRRAEDGGHGDCELFNVTISGPAGTSTTLVEIVPLDDEVTLVHFGRRGHRCTVHEVDGVCYVNSLLGQSSWRELPRFSDVAAEAVGAGPTAPVPGRVVAVAVAEGDVVTAGDTLVVLEAMKVEHRIAAPVDGVVAEVLVAVGDNVDAHRLLVRFEEPPS